MKTVNFYHTVKIQVVCQGYGQFSPDSDKEYDTFRDIVIDSSRELDRISPFMWGAHDIEWGECQRNKYLVSCLKATLKSTYGEINGDNDIFNTIDPINDLYGKLIDEFGRRGFQIILCFESTKETSHESRQIGDAALRASLAHIEIEKKRTRFVFGRIKE